MAEKIKALWKPGTLLYPLPPVLVSCGTLEKPNVMTVAWTGILNSDPAMTYISVRPTRYSYELIKRSSEFVLNLTTEALVRAADFCGCRSGRTVDKFKEMNLTAAPCHSVEAPQILESPLSLECRVKNITELGTHDMFTAEILCVHADEGLMDAKGYFQLEKSGLVAFSHGGYFGLGKHLGTFGFSVKKERPNLKNLSSSPKKPKK